MKKASRLYDTTADRDAEIALIMAMGRASAIDASKALDENDGA